MKQLIIFIFGCCLFNDLQAQSFYDLNTIQTIEVFFPFSNWDYKMDSASATEDYILASSVKVNGVSFDSVGVKYKGNSTYNVNNKKNPWHIELDHVKSTQEYQGFTDIKLGNNYLDPSFIREVLGFKLLQNYMHAPRANFVKLYVNGVYRGVYTSQEVINKGFVNRHFNSKEGPFFKCNKPNFMMPGNPDLVPGTGTSTWDSVGFYANRYEIKSTYGWKPFIQAQLDLKNSIDTLWDVDRALWMFAFNNVYVNLDSYTGAFAQNYYLYQDEYFKFNPIVWDANMCFGGFTQLNQGTPLNYSGMQQMTPLAQNTNTARPYISKLISQPRYKKQYIAHMKTMLDETIGNNLYYTLGAQMISLIDADVLADSLKFYSYNSFKNNLDTSVVMSGVSQRIGIKQLMAARYNFLSSHIEFSYAQPSITQIKQNNPSPFVLDSITITAKIANANYAYLGLKNDQYDHFSRLQMFDDGLHGDGNAGDSIFGIKIHITTSVTYYYLYAENNNAGIFSPVRAEHEFYSIQANIPNVPKQALVVNECMALNTKTINSPLGKPADWIEIKNTSSSTIPLYGLYLTDDTSNMTKWAFPPNTNLDSGKYLIVWCDEEKSNDGLHANFKLSSQGEKIYLTHADKSIVDSCIYGPLKADVSYGRCPESGNVYLNMIYPTPLQSNKCDTAVQSIIPNMVSGNDFFIYPNPASHHLFIKGSEHTQTTIYNLSGYPVLHTGETSCTLDHLANGIYFVVQPNKTPIKLLIQKE